MPVGPMFSLGQPGVARGGSPTRYSSARPGGKCSRNQDELDEPDSDRGGVVPVRCCTTALIHTARQLLARALRCLPVHSRAACIGPHRQAFDLNGAHLAHLAHLELGISHGRDWPKLSRPPVLPGLYLVSSGTNAQLATKQKEGHQNQNSIWMPHLTPMDRAPPIGAEKGAGDLSGIRTGVTPLMHPFRRSSPLSIFTIIISTVSNTHRQTWPPPGHIASRQFRHWPSLQFCHGAHSRPSMTFNA
ncbi:hypothetical protein GGR52DRAFT_239017 [Hypoxylon sp. FL1284]|nr:hypothetical protein GGR52DRAFT_239017 [Hypoxylon sp. FL1284]